MYTDLLNTSKWGYSVVREFTLMYTDLLSTSKWGYSAVREIIHHIMYMDLLNSSIEDAVVREIKHHHYLYYVMYTFCTVLPGVYKAHIDKCDLNALIIVSIVIYCNRLSH